MVLQLGLEEFSSVRSGETEERKFAAETEASLRVKAVRREVSALLREPEKLQKDQRGWRVRGGREREHW